MNEEEFVKITADAIEAAMRVLDAFAKLPAANPRALAVARTQFETAFLWLANSMGPSVMDGGQ